LDYIILKDYYPRRGRRGYLLETANDLTAVFASICIIWKFMT